MAATTHPDRLVASSCGPHTDHLGRVPGFSDYTVSGDLDDPYRWVVHYAPTVEPVIPPDATGRTKLRARTEAFEREGHLRRVAGVVEQGTDLISWFAHRPHRGSSGGMRHFRTYAFVDDAVAEICRRDQSYRRKLS